MASDGNHWGAIPEPSESSYGTNAGVVSALAVGPNVPSRRGSWEGNPMTTFWLEATAYATLFLVLLLAFDWVTRRPLK